MRALVEQADGYQVVLVASNRPQAPGLAWADEQAIPTWSLDSRGIGKVEWETALEAALSEHRVGTIALAGFMRLLSPGFTSRRAGRIVNIHPSLLPKYRGLDTHKRAIEAGDRLSGCTVHLVTEELDAGKIIARAEVPILPGDTPDALQARVLEAEHDLYPRAVTAFVSRTG